MDRLGSPPDMLSLGYVSWEEVSLSSDKGRREVHYYLKRVDGGSDLAVIGKERSLRHMSYHCAVRNQSPLSRMGPFLKPRSRREVIDWLNSIVSDSLRHESCRPAGSFDSSDVSELDIESFKDIQSQKMGHNTREFLWLGLPWTCRKRRKHYKSFRRNGVKISVHDFVFILAEEDKRLVAYLEDLYEDSKGNKMVVVRWFHKIDEVGIVLPHNFNDREIFFSLCLQDLSIECIDGLAAILSPQHFEKFLKEAIPTKLCPFVCHKQFENDEVKPFDITKLKGYWKQEILRYMFNVSPSKDQTNSQLSDESMKLEGNIHDAAGIRPRKKLRQSQGNVLGNGSKESVDVARVDNALQKNGGINNKAEFGTCSLRGETATLLPPTEASQNPQLKVGSEVEVLSQDSGIRGCWFRALIIKKHKDKVKVRYQDIQDAADEGKKLEEWILASKVAVPDQLGIRIGGRLVVRPSPQFNKDRDSWVVDVGTSVDAWWHDAWWEGIVVEKESEDKIHVYFPGEKQESSFSRADLRHSHEWLGNTWAYVKEKPDVVTSILSLSETRPIVAKFDENKLSRAAMCDTSEPRKIEAGCSDSSLEFECDKGKELGVVSDLSKDDLLARLRWKSSRKRKRVGGRSVKKMHGKVYGGKMLEEVIDSNACERFQIPMTLKVDREICKYMRDSLFNSSVVQPLASLVMSR